MQIKNSAVICWLGILVLANNVRGQTSSYSVSQKGADFTVWQETNSPSAGNHSYTELATGMNILRNGQWVAATETIQITPDQQAAVATNGQHQVRLAANLNVSGAVDTTEPDGQHLLSQIVGLAYFDPASSQSVAIAPLQKSFGSSASLASPNWTAVSALPVIVNGQNTVTNPISATQMFYRLSQ